mgnify:CR=1 FL=1
MTRQEMEDIVTALYMRRNFIETGTVTMSANDAVASKQHKIIKGLEPAQKATIARLEALAEKFLRASIQLSMQESQQGSVEAALEECKKWRMTDGEAEELLK